MDFISRFTKITKVVIDEINKPESFVKGDEFEAYIRTHLFVKDRYDIIQKTHDYTTNKDDFVENTKEPDYKFRSIKTGKEFFVEAKYRSDYYENAIEWCKFFQIDSFCLSVLQVIAYSPLPNLFSQHFRGQKIKSLSYRA